MIGDNWVLAALAVFDGGAWALAAYQLGRRMGGGPRASTPAEAFAALISALSRVDPTTPTGVTPREAVSSAERYGMGIDWDKVGEELVSYEKVRYGIGPGEGMSPETAKAAGKLRRMA